KVLSERQECTPQGQHYTHPKWPECCEKSIKCSFPLEADSRRAALLRALGPTLDVADECISRWSAQVTSCPKLSVSHCDRAQEIKQRHMGRNLQVEVNQAVDQDCRTTQQGTQPDGSVNV